MDKKAAMSEHGCHEENPGDDFPLLSNQSFGSSLPAAWSTLELHWIVPRDLGAGWGLISSFCPLGGLILQTQVDEKSHAIMKFIFIETKG
jgi:hypothetical protein